MLQHQETPSQALTMNMGTKPQELTDLFIIFLNLPTAPPNTHLVHKHPHCSHKDFYNVNINMGQPQNKSLKFTPSIPVHAFTQRFLPSLKGIMSLFLVLCLSLGWISETLGWFVTVLNQIWKAREGSYPSLQLPDRSQVWVGISPRKNCRTRGNSLRLCQGRLRLAFLHRKGC